MPIIRSISGLRAYSYSDITDTLIQRHAIAFHLVCPPGPIVIGRDGRPSGIHISNVLCQSFLSLGREVRDAGMVPTPTVQLLTELTEAAGGVVVTASHNPAEWNGLKFVDANGTFLAPLECRRLWTLADEADESEYLLQAPVPGVHTSIDDAVSFHINRILSLPGIITAPPSNPLSVVVDAVNASASFAAVELLTRLGFTVIPLYCDASGIFPHHPEPLPDHLGDLAAAVGVHNAALGVAIDPDGDRLVLADDTGSVISEEYTIAIAAMNVAYAVEAPFTVVVNLSTSRYVDAVATSAAWRVLRCPVGEINVVHAMKSANAVLGGEGSGGVIDPACHYGRDALVAIAHVTSLLKRKGAGLRQIVDGLPTLFREKRKIVVTADPTPILHSLHEYFLSLGGRTDTSDGVYSAWTDYWVHVRTSNTEPILRIIVEADSAALLASAVSSVTKYLESLE